MDLRANRARTPVLFLSVLVGAVADGLVLGLTLAASSRLQNWGSGVLHRTRNLVGGFIAVSLLLSSCSASSSRAVVHLPGFDMTVPAAWQVMPIPNPFGTKYVSNVALRDPCAVSRSGADCGYRPLVDSLEENQIVVIMSVPGGGPPPLPFSTLSGLPFTVDRHGAVWRVSSGNTCPGTHKVAGTAEADIELGSHRWLSIEACLGRDAGRLSRELVRAVGSIHFTGASLTGPPGPNSFAGSIPMS
jgi:hypothetical protein